MVEVQVLERGQVARTVLKPKNVAERLCKFKNSFRMVAPIEAPKKGTFEKVEEKLNKEETKTPGFEKELSEIAAITDPKDVEKLQPYLDHEAKTVQIAAGKQFRSLTDKKPKK